MIRKIEQRREGALAGAPFPLQAGIGRCARVGEGMTVSGDTFLHLRVGEGTIGFDGCGAIDLQRSEIGWAPEPDDIYQGEFDRMTAPSAAQIVMRRALKPFDVLLAPRNNVVLLHPTWKARPGWRGRCRTSCR